MQDRYTIGDPVCGLISVFPSRFEAQIAASRHEDWCKEPVSVYDRMAHFGAPEKWTSKGAIVARREE